jgi:3alpha(or 20beta)-hydroxysteroid dehydrogenase
MGRLDKKVCLITGAARGQGAEEARLFAREGGTVWLTDVLDDVGEKTAKEIGGTYRHLDVRSERGWTELVGEILKRDGRIDVLVNNAGIFRSNRMRDTSLEEFTTVMDVN